MDFQYLIIFYGVELIPDLNSKDKKTSQRRHFEPFIKTFRNYDVAKAWAAKHIDGYLYSANKWLVKVFEVFSVKEISSSSRMDERMSEKAKGKILDDLKEVIMKFVSNQYEKEYKMILLMQQRTMSFKSDRERHNHTAMFLINLIKKKCENEIAEFSTYYGGNLTSKMQEILVPYFFKLEAEGSESSGAGA